MYLVPVCNLSYVGGVVGGLWLRASPMQNVLASKKCEALSSNPEPLKKKRKTQQTIIKNPYLKSFLN
jgi:hypothetical protein